MRSIDARASREMLLDGEVVDHPEIEMASLLLEDRAEHDVTARRQLHLEPRVGVGQELDDAASGHGAAFASGAVVEPQPIVPLGHALRQTYEQRLMRLASRVAHVEDLSASADRGGQ